MRNVLSLLVFVFVTIEGFSQDNLNELTVDRPGFADSPFTVPVGMYQFEIGFDYFQRYNGNIYHTPIALFRTGIAKRSEVRISSRQLLDKTDGSTFNGISSLSAGIKTHIIKEKEWFPETDVMANVIVPVGYSAHSKSLGYELLLLFQHEFYPKTAINYNVGYVWDIINEDPVFTASICYNYLPTQRLGLFIEYFDFIPNRWPGEQGIDGGFTYLLSSKIQADFSGGISRLTEQNNFFISAGLSFRLGKNRNRVPNPSGNILKSSQRFLN